MSHYSSELKVAADPDQVFDYVKKPENMPKYLPTVHGAHDEGAGRVAVDGEAAGHAYHSDGWFKIDDAARTMSWGSDGENEYSGSLTVRAHEDHSHLEVRLDFKPNPGQEKAFEAQTGSRDETVQNGLDAALRSIKNEVEGHGGKVPTPAD